MIDRNMGPMTRRVAVLVLGLAFAAGCDKQEYISVGPGFGDAVVNNAALQIVDPMPPEITEPPVMDGERAALAMEKYKGNQVVKPKAQTTGGPLGGGGK